MSEHLQRLQSLTTDPKYFAYRLVHMLRTGADPMDNEAMKRVLANTQPDEPVFVLCARDKTAPSIIREWAAQAGARGAPPSKTVGARAIAEDMERWQEEHPELVKVPD